MCAQWIWNQRSSVDESKTGTTAEHPVICHCTKTQNGAEQNQTKHRAVYGLTTCLCLQIRRFNTDKQHFSQHNHRLFVYFPISATNGRIETEQRKLIVWMSLHRAFEPSTSRNEKQTKWKADEIMMIGNTSMPSIHVSLGKRARSVSMSWESFSMIDFSAKMPTENMKFTRMSLQYRPPKGTLNAEVAPIETESDAKQPNENTEKRVGMSAASHEKKWIDCEKYVF